jgi:RNA polymerase sigma-70 factor (ECF subfamily)
VVGPALAKPHGMHAVQSNRGSHAEFERNVAPHVSGLRSAARRLSRDTAEADDLVQETLLRAFRFWDRYQIDTHLRAWLHRILRNAFVNEYRRRTRERDVLLQARAAFELSEHEREHEAGAAEIDGSLTVALDALPEEYRSVLWAIAVDDASYREAAERLGCPVGTVMSRLHRARRGMRVLLRDERELTAELRADPAARSAA